jgi:hypothetical protein
MKAILVGPARTGRRSGARSAARRAASVPRRLSARRTARQSSQGRRSVLSWSTCSLSGRRRSSQCETLHGAIRATRRRRRGSGADRGPHRPRLPRIQGASCRRSRHVGRILLVARCIGEDEGRFLRREITVRYIDRNALFPLGRQTADQKGKIGCLPLGAEALRVPVERRRPIFQHGIRIEQKPAQKRQFSFIDRSAGHQMQKRHPMSFGHKIQQLKCGTIRNNPPAASAS